MTAEAATRTPTPRAPADPILVAREATKIFRVGSLLGRRASVHAVDRVDLVVEPGETLGIVGESGSGKSTLAAMLVGDERPTSGEVWVGGQPVHELGARGLRNLRRTVQLIHQDPYTSLDPRMTVEQIVSEPLQVHHDLVPRRGRRARAVELLGLVGLGPEALERRPHQFSGGQRQRIGIARALAVQPRVLVCDEPVSALDVSVQAQVINLLDDLRSELGLAVVFIAHDLSVVHHIADRVAVMYLGQIVEEGTPEQLHDHSQHPYTRALLAAVPDPTRLPGRVGRGHRPRIVLEGEIPSPLDPPSGCRFRTRCWQSEDRCAEEQPALAVRRAADDGQRAACHFPLAPPEPDGS